MMSQKSLYTLEKYNGRNRYTCPACGKHREFTRYVDTQTNAHLAEHVGKCNRENNCGYHYTPKEYFEQHSMVYEPSLSYSKTIPPKIAEPSYHTPAEMQATLRCYDQNNFVHFLFSIFQAEITKDLIERFHIGTSKAWQGKGATIFWQLDKLGNIRAGKVMLYDQHTGKRVKEPFNHISWVHSLQKNKDFNLVQCFFGEHQLRYEPLDKPIALVESEKTAIIATAFFPQYSWLATGGKNGAKWASDLEVGKALAGRKVVLFPDTKAHADWLDKSSILKSFCSEVIVSDFLQKNATEEALKYDFDLADYCLNVYLNPDTRLAERDGFPFSWNYKQELKLPNTNDQF